MKKLLVLLAVFALSVSYTYAQNANSGVTVTKNSGEWVLLDDCGGVYAAQSSTTVQLANGNYMYTGLFDISGTCEVIKKATHYYPAPGVTILVTPGGKATLKIKWK